MRSRSPRHLRIGDDPANSEVTAPSHIPTPAREDLKSRGTLSASASSNRRSASGGPPVLSSSRLVGVEESGLVGENDGLGTVAQVEFLEQAGDVGLHGGAADEGLVPDLGVGEAAGDQAEHVPPPRRGGGAPPPRRPAAAPGGAAD